jgi:hypothetical protein
MWVMTSGTPIGALLVGLAMIAACGDDAESAATGSARGTDPDATAGDASGSRPGGAVVRLQDGGGQGIGADASTLDGGLDGSVLDGGHDGSVLDGGLDASLDGSVADAMPSPMPIEDASFDARAGTGGVGGLGGRGGVGGAAAVGGF